jgi:hypothetical protein
MSADHQVIAPQRKVNTAIVWDLKPKPWCWRGPEFREECDAIASGLTPETGPQRARSPETNLRELREGRGLTQRALAKLIGCGQPQINRSEHGGGGKWPAIIRKALEG